MLERAHLSKSRWCNVARSIRKSFSSAFPPLFHAAFHYTTLETESTRAGGREKIFCSFVHALASDFFLWKKSVYDETTMNLFTLRRLGFTSRHNLFLCCCCCRYQGGVQDFFLLSLFFSSPTFCKSLTCREQRDRKGDPLDRLQQVCCSCGGVIMVTLSADSACGENRYFPHFVFREARACPICLCLSLSLPPVRERAPQLGCVVLDARTRARSHLHAISQSCILRRILLRSVDIWQIILRSLIMYIFLSNKWFFSPKKDPLLFIICFRPVSACIFNTQRKMIMVSRRILGSMPE